MRLRERLVGKWWSARSLAEFLRYFENGAEVWRAYRANRPLPPLRLRGGPTIYCRPDDDPVCLFRELMVRKCYTSADFYTPKPGDVVLDFGSNIGMFALYLQWVAPGITVHCFEPSSETRARLRNNVEANGLASHVTIHPYAVSDRRQTVCLGGAKIPAQRSIFPSEFRVDDGGEEVETLSLHEAFEICGVTRVDLLKLDVEGAEIEAVEGADPGVWSKVQRVAFEYHDRFRPGCRDRVSRALEGHGFRVRVAEVSPLEGMGIVHATR